MKITIKNASGDIVKTLDADLNKTLLKQLEAEGIEIPSACFTGICGACMCEIEQGEEFVEKEAITASGFPLSDEEVMTCIAKVKTDSEGEIVLKSMY
jgi:ferredoxin